MNILVYKDEWSYSVINLFVENSVYFLRKKGHNVTIIPDYAIEKVHS